MLGRIKKYICVLLSALIIFGTCFVFVSANSEANFAVKVFGEDECTISWWKSDLDGKYYIFLPSDCKTDKLEVALNGADSITVDGRNIHNAETTDAFAKGGEYKIDLAGNTYNVVFLKSANLPSVYIKTESGSLDAIHADKNHKEKADITVVQDGETIIDNADLDYIKGRGNSTWRLDKKPYNIKFESKTNLFSLGKAKKWSLIASANEKSLIRNKSVYDLAQDVGLDYSSQSQHVDLYINGSYEGNYLVCESVEVGSERVDITDLEEENELANPSINIKECEQIGSKDKQSGFVANTKKWVDIPNDPADISGGYLLEFEQCNRYYKEVSGFTTKIGQPVTFKSPEYASKAQVEYISSYYQEFEDAVYSSDGKNSLGKYYSDYIDMTKMARMYIIQELAMNLDASTTSFYLYKDAGSDKFVASPVWDFDYSLGEKASRNGVDLTNPELWYAQAHYVYDTRGLFEAENPDFATLLTQLCTHDDFMKIVKAEWEKSFLPALGEKRYEKMTSLYTSLCESAVMDAIRWNRYETNSTDENLKEYKKIAKGVVDFLEKREKALRKGLAENGAQLIYDANGASGCTYNNQILSVGDKAVLKGSNFESPGYRYFFRGWNTKPDGSGKSFSSGDEMVMESSKVTLYAQWQKVSLFSATAAHALELMLEIFSAIFNKIIGGLR